MRALVCVKQIVDPEIPARDFRINRDRLEADAGDADLVPNIFCENALETALKLREAAASKTVTSDRRAMKRYCAFARMLTRQQHPVLVAMTGYSGSGKS